MSTPGSSKSSGVVLVSQDPAASREKLLPPSPKQRFCSTGWLWETLSLLVSAGCIVAVLVLLLVYNDKPIPTWRFITLNTAISILAVVAKSALLVTVAESISQNKWFWFWSEKRSRPVADFQRFDSASRGPWGSTMLLLQPRTWCLVTVGAFVTSAALGMEPSLQQIQMYAVRTVNVGEGLITRASNYSDLELDASDGAQPILGISVKGAVYSGLFASSSSNNLTGISATCPTGNCTWPAYSTLEFCSACKNVTSQLSRYFDGTQMPEWSLGANNTTNGDAYMAKNSINSGQQVMVLSSEHYDNTSAFDSMGSSPLVTTTMLFFPPNSEATMEIPKAFQCILYFCVKTYTAEMREGVLSQELVSNWPNISSPPLTRDEKTTGTAYLEPTTDLANQTYIYPTAHPISDFWILRPGVHQAHVNQTFGVNIYTFAQLSAWLQGKITGDISMDPDVAGLVDDVSQVFYDAATANQLSSTRSDNSDRVMPGPAAIFERLASSLTAHLLSRSNEKALGSSQSLETFVRARWAWAILPVTLVLMTAMFLMVTAITTSRRDMPVWKSSALPGLIHGLDEGACVVLGGYKPEDLGRMERRAKNYWVNMSDSGGTVRLRARKGLDT